MSGERTSRVDESDIPACAPARAAGALTISHLGKFIVLLLVASGVATAATIVSGSAVSAAGVSLSQDDLAAIAQKNVLAYTPAVFTMDQLASMAQAGRESRDFSLGVAGATYTVSSHLDRVFDPEALAAVPSYTPLKGTLVEDPGSTVRLSIGMDSAVLHGFVRFSDGRQFAVEPIHDIGPLHIWYDEANAIISFKDGPSVPLAEKAPPAEPVGSPPAARKVAEDPANATMIHPMLLAGMNTYRFTRLWLYYDSTTFKDQMGAMAQRADDVYNRELGTELRVKGVVYTDPNQYHSIYGCTDGYYTHLLEFHDLVPSAGSGADYSDRLFEFTNFGSFYDGYDGCGALDGMHAFARWNVGSDANRGIMVEHELGHTFSAVHDLSSVSNPCHWHWYGCHVHHTIMYSPASDSTIDETFSTPSRNAIAWGADSGNNTLSRKLTAWTGSSTSSDGVVLTEWEMNYNKGLSGGGIVQFERNWHASAGTISLSQVFVGARDPSGANIDFGYLGAKTLTTSATVDKWTWTSPYAYGTYSFWPAYQYNGHYGPYQWQQIQVTH